MSPQCQSLGRNKEKRDGQCKWQNLHPRAKNSRQSERGFIFKQLKKAKTGEQKRTAGEFKEIY